MNQTGYKVLAFDFSGSGESEDALISVEREIDDLKSAIRYLENEKEVKRIGLYGHSLGGLVSLKNDRENVHTMNLTSPVTEETNNYREHRFEGDDTYTHENGYYVKHRDKGVRKEIKIDEQIIEERENLNQEKLLENIETPVQIIHGDQDQVVPLKDSQKVVKKLENSNLQEIHGLTHSYDIKLEEIKKYTENWFKKHITP